MIIPPRRRNGDSSDLFSPSGTSDLGRSETSREAAEPNTPSQAMPSGDLSILATGAFAAPVPEDKPYSTLQTLPPSQGSHVCCQAALQTTNTFSTCPGNSGLLVYLTTCWQDAYVTSACMFLSRAANTRAQESLGFKICSESGIEAPAQHKYLRRASSPALCSLVSRSLPACFSS